MQDKQNATQVNTVSVPQMPTEQMRRAFLREYTSPANFERAYVAMIAASAPSRDVDGVRSAFCGDERQS